MSVSLLRHSPLRIPTPTHTQGFKERVIGAILCYFDTLDKESGGSDNAATSKQLLRVQGTLL
jgi:hypothetical protein